MESLRLPDSLVNQGDVMRLLRELNSLNDFFAGAAARKAGTPVQPPKTTRILDQMAQINELNLLESQHRQALTDGLNYLLAKAPKLHISFASEPNPKAVEPILIWLRKNIHPQVLLQVGLQPSIAAGCMLRTSNKIFDMSIRTYLQKQAHLLNELIAGAVHG